jgi:hypothetical protein
VTRRRGEEWAIGRRGEGAHGRGGEKTGRGDPPSLTPIDQLRRGKHGDALTRERGYHFGKHDSPVSYQNLLIPASN